MQDKKIRGPFPCVCCWFSACSSYFSDGSTSVIETCDDVFVLHLNNQFTKQRTWWRHDMHNQQNEIPGMLKWKRCYAIPRSSEGRDTDGTIYAILYLVFGGTTTAIGLPTCSDCNLYLETFPKIILYMCSANERRRCAVTTSLIGWAVTQNDPCIFLLLSNRLLRQMQTRRSGKCWLYQHLSSNTLLTLNILIIPWFDKGIKSY